MRQPSQATEGPLGSRSAGAIFVLALMAGALALAAPAAAPAVPAAAAETVTGFDGADVDRLSGPQRFATAAAISQHSFPDGADIAYVATGHDFADALAGSVAAARDGSPVLLVTADRIPDDTATELDRLEPDRIILLGGAAAVSDTVADELGERIGTEPRWIAYSAVNDGLPLRLVSVGGTAHRELPMTRAEQPTWTADGRSISYVETTGEGADLQRQVRRIDVDTGDLIDVTADGVSLLEPPAMSADGARIAFRGEGDDGRTGLYVADADGSGAELLVEAEPVPPDVEGEVYGQASWAPEGDRLVAVHSFEEWGQLILVDVETATAETLTTDDGAPVEGFHPDWSPDGERIAFTATEITADGPAQFPVKTIRPDGSGLTRVTADGRSPSWAPDSRRLAFAHPLTEGGFTILDTVTGSATTRIADTPVFNVAWQPRPE